MKPNVEHLSEISKYSTKRKSLHFCKDSPSKKKETDGRVKQSQ